MLKKKSIITASTALALGLGSIGLVSNSQTADAATYTTKTIMSKSLVYNHQGKSTGKTIKTYKKVNVYGQKVKIKNKTYYKIGKNKYVKAINIDGTSRTVYHNAYIYNNEGKKVKSNVKLLRGTSHATYGKIANVKSNKMYRIGRNQYVKLANFKYNAFKSTTQSPNSNYEEVSPGVFVEKSASTSKQTATKTNTSKKNVATTKSNKQSSIDKGWSDALKKADKQMSDILNKKSNSKKSSSSSNSGYTEVSDGVYVEEYNTYNDSQLSQIKTEFLNYLNNWRKKQGLAPFTTISWLSNGAQQRASEALAYYKQNRTTSHIRPNGDRFWTAFSNPDSVRGEVIAPSLYASDSPKTVAKSMFDDLVYHDEASNWGHKKILQANLANPAIGIGVTTTRINGELVAVLVGDTAELN